MQSAPAAPTADRKPPQHTAVAAQVGDARCQLRGGAQHGRRALWVNRKRLEREPKKMKKTLGCVLASASFFFLHFLSPGKEEEK
jgi:hypothetical protein